MPAIRQIAGGVSGQSIAPAVPVKPQLSGNALPGAMAFASFPLPQGAAIEMAGLFPRSRFTGLDFSQEAISAAEAEAARRNVPNVRFDVQDLATLDTEDRYDLVTAFDAIHDQVRPADVLRNVNRALRADGLFLMQDIAMSSYVHRNDSQPLATFIYTISCMHCMSVSLACKGEGLGAAWGREKALQMLREAGFVDVRIEQLPHDTLNYYYLARPAR